MVHIDCAWLLCWNPGSKIKNLDIVITWDLQKHIKSYLKVGNNKPTVDSYSDFYHSSNSSHTHIAPGSRHSMWNRQSAQWFARLHLKHCASFSLIGPHSLLTFPHVSTLGFLRLLFQTSYPASGGAKVMRWSLKTLMEKIQVASSRKVKQHAPKKEKQKGGEGRGGHHQCCGGIESRLCEGTRVPSNSQ